ncbi:MAG: hypothetical protein HOP10_13495 [Chitinophagaceae bacterium]|nr:hypothetical protein [Chitinophagaceae bacterium]
MKKFSFFIIVLALLASCGGKKKKPSMTGEEKVEISDFIDFFQPVRLPFYYADSMMNKKQKDTFLISYKIFTQFVPDSVLGKVYGKNTKISIHALGKFVVPKAETYLFVKTTTTDKKVIFILAFDRDQKYAATLPSLRPDQVRTTFQSVTMDKKLGITKMVQRKNANGTISEGKDVYVFDRNVNDFTLVMTDALEDKPMELINPIDTLPRKHKWSADYLNGKRNLVSVRDGRRNDRISFFIHFEKNNADCIGELKGEAKITSSNSAEFRVDGDPCVLTLIFSSSSVRLREEEGCGNHRGIQCLFDGSFSRKKETKPKKSTKK